MIMMVYSMLDKKAKAYGAPVVFQNDAVAERTAMALRQDENSDMGRFPADFSLFQIGEFSSETGVFTPVTLRHVFDLVDLAV